MDNENSEDIKRPSYKGEFYEDICCWLKQKKKNRYITVGIHAFKTSKSIFT